MSTRHLFHCDSCGGELRGSGVIHSTEKVETKHGTLSGFVIYAWNEEAALSPTFGHLHKDTECIQRQVDRYLEVYKWGRIVKRSGSKIVTRKGH